jgi:transposase
VKMKTTSPQVVIFTREALQAWKSRMEARIPPDVGADAVILGVVVETYLFLVGALAKAHVSLRRLKRWLFGPRSEKKRNLFPGEPAEGDSEHNNPSNEGGTPGSKKKKNRIGEARPKEGHGRRGTKDYPGAERIPVPHPKCKPGCPCPVKYCDGKLYRMKRPREILRFFGQALLIAKIWLQERWRCNRCLEIVRAPLPAEATGPRHDVTAVVMLALARFGYGLPSYRLQQHQESQGVPLAASVQMTLLSRAYKTLVPLFDELVRQAAQFELFHNDDTGMKVLELLDEIKQARGPSGSDADSKKKQRTGLYTTGILAVSLVHGYQIALYYTGRKHAGENLAAVLSQRKEGLPPPIHESDGLDHNKPGDIEVITGKCLTHGRRGFADISSSFPEQCRHVITMIGEVYHVESLAKERKLSIEDRLLLHQEKSGPVMDSLRRWLVNQLLETSEEPNSGLGGAIKYMLKRWESLTRFLTVPGAPLDNTPCERILKAVVRYRKNSLFYKTTNGARVGDLFLSLFETCNLNHVDKVHYLNAVLSHIESVRMSPGSWMPWNYQAMVRGQAAATDVQERHVVDTTEEGSVQNSQVTDHDASGDDQELVTAPQGCGSAPPASRGDDSRFPRPTEPINAASPVESKTPPDPGRPGNREEAMVAPEPTRCGPAHRGRPEEARSPT